MANDIADKASWFINSASQGNKRLKRLDKFDVSNNASKEPVNEVGSSDPVGWTRSPGDKTIKFDFVQTKGAKPDVDWDLLAETDETFSLTIQYTGGQRIQFPEVTASSVSSTGDSGGKNTYSVECSALTRKKL